MALNVPPELGFSRMEALTGYNFDLKMSPANLSRMKSKVGDLHKIWSNREAAQINTDHARAIAYQIMADSYDKVNPARIKSNIYVSENERLVILDVIASSAKEGRQRRLIESGKNRISLIDKNVRSSLPEIIFRQSVFTKHYSKWKLEYKERAIGDQTFLKEYPDLESYVLAKGVEFIDELENQVVAGHVTGLSAVNDVEDEQARLKEQDRIATIVNKFYHDHQEELMQIAILDNSLVSKQKSDVLYKQFKVALKCNSKYDNEIHDLLYDLSELAISTMATKVKYQSLNGTLSMMADSGLNDDDWEAVISKKTEDLAKYTEASLQEASNFEVSDVDSRPKLNTLEDVQDFAGVKIIGGNEIDGFTAVYPHSSVIAKFKIVKDAGAKNYENADFVIENKFVDNGKGDSLTVKADGLRLTFNQVYLDYLFNRGVLNDAPITEHSGNKFLHDGDMLQFAEKLFNKELGKVAIVGERRDTFKRLLILLLADDGNTEFGNLSPMSRRVELVKRLFNQTTTNYPKQIRQVLKDPNAKEKFVNLSGLLRSIGYMEPSKV